MSIKFPEIFDDADAIEDCITFDYELEGFEVPQPELLSQWIENIVTRENKTLHSIAYVFGDDEWLLQLNREYLDHDTYTDIITFPFSEDDDVIEGDIYISVERIRENAVSFGVPFETELRRVMIHGVLHLCGYFDKTDEQEALMRQKEDEALKLF